MLNLPGFVPVPPAVDVSFLAQVQAFRATAIEQGFPACVEAADRILDAARREVQA